MIKTLLILAMSAFISVVNAQSKIHVEITGIKSEQGCIMLKLLDANKKQVVLMKGEIQNGSCAIEINGMTTGKYAISYYHDENGNGELDTNMIGIPKEGYGFSNDAYGKYGPKDFEEWLFNVDTETTIELKTAYL